MWTDVRLTSYGNGDSKRTFRHWVGGFSRVNSDSIDSMENGPGYLFHGLSTLFHRVRWGEVKQSSERERERERHTVEKRFISEILGWREEIAVMAGAPEIRIHRGGGELERREIFLIS